MTLQYTRPSRPLKGSNLTTVRGVNERLVLHLLRIHKRLSKADTTRLTGLSANAISMLFKSLEKDGLLLRDAPIRGRRGQPSIPIKLNPDARHYIGFKIGRHSFDIVILNFIGSVKARITQHHRYPTPDNTVQFIIDNTQPLLKSAGLTQEDISAFNIATPFELWSWVPDFDAPTQEMDSWRDFDLISAITSHVPWPVTLENDCTAACRAEMVFGPSIEAQDLVYFFVGTFIGGGVVLNGSVFAGRRGTAGGFGPLRVPHETGGERLVDHASLVVLEHLLAIRDAKLAITIYSEDSDWSTFEPEVSTWITRVGRSLGHAIVSTQAVIDFETIIIDGAFPIEIRERLVKEVIFQFNQLDLQGIVHPEIKAGNFGPISRALGAGAYQISNDFMINQNTLLRGTPAIAYKEHLDKPMV